MKHVLKIAALVSILPGCAAMDTFGERSASPLPSNAPNAIMRPAAPQAAEPAPVETAAADPQVETVEQEGIDPSIDPATARSYQASWEDGSYRHRSVMFPHVIDGCKVLVQSRRTLDYVGGDEGEFIEREGPDCDCNLVIDGMEDTFAQLNDSYKTPRMHAVCVGPGVDGATRQLEIMRESLKEQRNFDKMKNVEGF